MVKFYIFLAAGVVWIAVGLRDLFAPGFLAQNGRVVSAGRIAVNFFSWHILSDHRLGNKKKPQVNLRRSMNYLVTRHTCADRG